MKPEETGPLGLIATYTHDHLRGTRPGATLIFPGSSGGVHIPCVSARSSTSEPSWVGAQEAVLRWLIDERGVLTPAHLPLIREGTLLVANHEVGPKYYRLPFASSSPPLVYAWYDSDLNALEHVSRACRILRAFGDDPYKVWLR